MKRALNPHVGCGHMYEYAAYGLSITSELPLPELMPSTAAGTADVTISLGDVPAELDSPGSQGVLYQANPNQFLLRLDNVARYLVQNGRQVIVQPEPNSLDSDIRVFLLASCLGALLHQRGVLALHASSIWTDKGAVLFMGPSGMGKSTLLGAFLCRGYAMLADDISAAVLDDQGQPVALPAFPRTKLWADSAKLLEKDISELPRVRPTQEKYELVVPDQFAAQAAAPRHVYLLTTTNTVELSLEPIDQVHRFGVLVNNTYRVSFLDGLSMRPAHFQLASTLARHVPVTKVIRPHDSGRLDELVDLVEGHFQAEQGIESCRAAA